MAVKVTELFTMEGLLPDDKTTDVVVLAVETVSGEVVAPLFWA